MRKTLALFLILIVSFSPFLSAQPLEYFEETEEGYLLPFENEYKLVNYVNDLKNEISDLKQALEEERKATDKLIESKNDVILSLESQIENKEAQIKELEKIIENKDEIIALERGKNDLISKQLKRYASVEEINAQIIEGYETNKELYKERVEIEKTDSIKSNVNWFVYGAVAGSLLVLYTK